MRKLVACFLCMALLLGTGSVFAETLTGTAEGFGGPVTVSVEVEDGKITKVEIVEQSETPAIAGDALEQLPAAIVEKGSTDVDMVSGATYTSTAIIEAVNNALNPEAAAAAEEAAEEAPAEPVVLDAAEAYIGFGLSNSGRVGPGKDDKDVPVYSINQVFAQLLFDAEGKILFAKLDQLEVATPNYDGASMPHMTGWPGQSYNNDENHDEKVDGVLEATEDSFLAEVSSWATKRQRGDGYRLNTGTWSDQMNFYEQLFVGKTVEEVNEWFAKYTSDRNGRPLKAGSENEQDKAKYDALSDEDKAMLADVTATATMSLKDSHGDILAALANAYENRQPVKSNVASIGLGLNFLGRLGPGKDDKDVGVYSFNEVYATTLFDAEGRVAQLYVDQLEVATPNYDGASMPHLTGFPGQSYNNDENHDEKVDGVLEATEESFLSEIAGWTTKRQRGEGYKLGTGTWTDQMNSYEQLFVGKTVEEIKEWAAKYTSDRNARPLKADSQNEQDKAKYDALSDEDKALLADVTATATMSVNDAHGNILAAIEQSFQNKVDVTLTLSK